MNATSFSPPAPCVHGRGTAFTLIAPDSSRWEAVARLGTVITPPPCPPSVIATSMHQKATACGEEKAGKSHAELNKRYWGCWVWWMMASSSVNVFPFLRTEWQRQMFQPWELIFFTRLRQVLRKGLTFEHKHTKCRHTHSYKGRWNVCFFYFACHLLDFLALSKSVVRIGMKCGRPWTMFIVEA